MKCAAAILVVLAGAGSVRADETQSKPPYHLRVVLQVAPHRSLTPLFQDQLRREVGDQLRLALGGLAQVEMVRTHELLGEIETRGLKQALDGWDKLEEQQVHFVLLNYAAGTYQLEARGHDGSTGQASPLVRQAQTCDRSEVATLAARLVEHDFAPVGTVSGSGKEVKLLLKGGDALGRWVKKGDVFAVSRIVQEGGRTRGLRIPWALLEVSETPREGSCRCHYWHRYREDDLRPAGDVSYRAVKLPATRGPLRLRLLEDETFRPLDGMVLRVLRPDAKKGEELTTRNGLAVTRDDYRHLALVQVGSSDNPLAQFPVAILDEGPVDCRVKVRPEAEALAPLENRRDLWVRRVYDGLNFSGFVAQRLKERLNQSLEAALKEGQNGLKNLDGELAQLVEERDDLQKLARGLKRPATLELSEGEQRLDELKQRHKQLQDFVGRVDETIKEAKGEKIQRAHKLLEQARLLESEAEFDKAIQTYKEVLAVTPEQAKIRAYLEQLEKRWEPRTDAQREARKFIYEIWPGLDVAGMKENLEKARAALKACKDANDRLTPLRLQRANAVHAAQLKRQLDALKQLDNEDNRNQARALAQIAEDLRRLHAEVTAAVAGKAE
jgi:hypothetical protein